MISKRNIELEKECAALKQQLNSIKQEEDKFCEELVLSMSKHIHENFDDFRKKLG
jgi:hypothetical protein